MIKAQFSEPLFQVGQIVDVPKCKGARITAIHMMKVFVSPNGKIFSTEWSYRVEKGAYAKSCKESKITLGEGKNEEESG